MNTLQHIDVPIVAVFFDINVDIFHLGPNEKKTTRTPTSKCVGSNTHWIKWNTTTTNNNNSTKAETETKRGMRMKEKARAKEKERAAEWKVRMWEKYRHH